VSKRHRHYLHPVEETIGNVRQVYGFRWGPLSVVRLAHVEGRGYVLSVQTEHHPGVEVRVSEKGHVIKVIDRHAELKRRIRGNP